MKTITLDWDTYQAELKAQYQAGKRDGDEIKRLKPLLDFAWDLGAVERVNVKHGGGRYGPTSWAYNFKPLLDLTKDQIVQKIRHIMFQIGEFK